MKAFAKQAIRGEQGQALILALILLLVSGLMIAPLLSFMGTGLRTGEVYETKTDELYAADAGVEQAVRRLSANHSANFTIHNINNKSVVVNTTIVGNTTRRSGCNVTTILTYRVESTATGDGSGTRIVAYVNATSVSLNYSGVMDQILTSLGTIDVAQKVKLDYCVPCGCGPAPCVGCSCEPYPYYPAEGWPPAHVLDAFYRDRVKAEGATPQYSNVDIVLGSGETRNLEPLDLRNNAKLTVSGTGTLVLTGTLYITGDTNINGQNDNNPIRLKLNGKTIFVGSNTTGAKYALDIGQCIIEGPGIIVAVGDFKFAPKMDVGMTAPVFAMSVSGTTKVWPSGDFHGAIAGNITVDVSAGTTPEITYPAGGFGDLKLNFPSLSEVKRDYSILSWEVKPA